MKLKKLLNENLWNERKFGQSLPTLEDTTKAYKLKKEQEVKEGGPGSGRPAKPGSARDIEKRMSAAADDANARLDAAEKAMKAKKKKVKEVSLTEDNLKVRKEALYKINYMLRYSQRLGSDEKDDLKELAKIVSKIR